MQLVIALLLVVAAASASAFEVVDKAIAIDGNPDLTESVWRATVPPGDRYDRLGLHRIEAPQARKVAVMLYLPGTNMNGEIAVTDEAYNLWLYLARRGVIVYTLDYRTHFVPNEPVPEDLSFMSDWTLARFVDDAELAVDEIRRQTDLPLFVAGFSRGATYAYALAGRAGLDGLIALDGSFKDYSPEGFNRAAAMKELEQSGQYGSILSRSRGWSARTELMQRAAEDPGGPAMGEFDSIGDQLTSTLYYAWGEGALANPVDGISRIDVLARAMTGYDRVFPAIQNIEGRSISAHGDDPATPLDDHFGAMSLPIVYFGATNLGGDHLMSGIYSATKSGSDDVTLHVLENHGHLDVLFGEQVAEAVFDEILGWITPRATE